METTTDTKVTDQQLLDAIPQRHSVRAYTTTPIEPEKVDALNAYIDECNKRSGLSMKLITNEPDTFGKSLMARYGKFSNADNYIAIIGPRLMDTMAGYYGEKLVLYAQSIGLNTCWVVLTYKKGGIKKLVGDYEQVYCLISIGYGTAQGVGHKIKKPQQVSRSYDTAPEWFRKGVDMALLAPTALNQQKFRFELTPDGKVHASRGIGYHTKIDLGIAMQHFKLGALPTSFQWG